MHTMKMYFSVVVSTIIIRKDFTIIFSFETYLIHYFHSKLKHLPSSFRPDMKFRIHVETNCIDPQKGACNVQDPEKV